MKKLSVLLTLFLVLSFVFTVAGCGDDEEDTTPTPKATVTQGPAATATPTPVGYTGGKETLKVSHSQPTGSLVHEIFLKIDELLQQYTDGQVKLEIFPASSLYPSDAEWSALTSGGIDMLGLGSSIAAKEGLMDFMLEYMPYFYGSEGEDIREHDRRVIEHPDGGPFLMAQLEPHGIKPLCMVPTIHMLFRINNQKEVFDYADMAGWKVNSEGGISNMLTKMVGGIGVDISGQELLVAYEQGIIDSITMGPGSVYAYGLAETNKYGLIYWGVVSHATISMNMDKWNSLSPELQSIFEDKVIPEFEDWLWVRIEEEEWEAIDKCEAAGMITHEQSAAERLSFQAKLMQLPEAQGYFGYMTPEFVRLVDALRSEPYDVSPNFD